MIRPIKEIEATNSVEDDWSPIKFATVIVANAILFAFLLGLAWLISIGLLCAPTYGAEELPPPIPPQLLRWGVPEGTVTYEGNWCFAFDGRTRIARWTLEYLTAE